MSAAKVKVMHVIEAIEGGTIRHVADLVRVVDDVEHVVVAPARRSRGVTDESALAAIASHARVLSLAMTRNPATITNVRAVRALHRLVERERPDVVHAHSTIAGLLTRTRQLASPVLYTPNGVQPSVAARATERLLASRSAAIVAVSTGEASVVHRARLAQGDRVVVIPNGIEGPPATQPPTLDLRSHLNLASGTPLVGTAIRLVRQKAPLVFVEAADVVLQHDPQAHAVLMGDGPLRRGVERAAQGIAHRERLHILGHVPHASSLFAQLDVFVLPSRFEGMPYALLEAMAAGCAVVATDVTGSSDAVESGASGLLVPPGDAPALAAAMTDLLRDRPRRERLGEAAQMRVAREFSLEHMAAAHRELYARMAARRERE